MERCHSVSAVVYSVFKTKFVTRAEPDALSASPHPALEVFGDEAVFLLNEFPAENFADKHELVAVWRLQATGDTVEINKADICMQLNFPWRGQTSLYTKAVPAHVNAEVRLCLVRELDGAIVIYFPTVVFRGMSTISNILCVRNAFTEPKGVHRYGGKVYRTSTPYVIMQVFQSPKDAYKACCAMEREIFGLKKNRVRLSADFLMPDEDSHLLSYQRPCLVRYETAKKICEKTAEIVEQALISEKMSVPSEENVVYFQNMWTSITNGNN